MKRILLIIATVVCTHIQATHNRAGEILYKRVAPFTAVVGGITIPVYTYSITVVRYTDYAPTVADRCVDTVYFGDGTSGIAPRVNGSTNCSCGTYSGTVIACGTLLINTSSYKVHRSEYSVIHTYPGSGTYIIYSKDPNRNAGVINITNSDTQPLYIESKIIVSNSVPLNSSPVLTLPPIDQAVLGNCFYHNSGAVDADGDSLSYQIVPCMSGPGQPATGYTHPATGSQGSFSINPTTGLLTWCVPQLIGEYNMAFVISEWRKNAIGQYQLIGTVERDMQVLVKYNAVDLAKNAVSESLELVPNPFTNQLELEFVDHAFDKIVSCLYTTDGRQVYTQTDIGVKGKLNLTPKELLPGIYLLKVQSDEFVIYRKVVKE